MRSRWFLLGSLATLGGVVALALGIRIDPQRALYSHLIALSASASVTFGALFFIMLGHAARAGWFVVLRRVTQSIAAALPACLILFLPIAFGLRHIYPWAMPHSALTPQLIEAIEKKGSWLSPSAFLIRALIYFVILIWMSELLRVWSHRNYAAPAPVWLERQRVLSGLGLPVFGLVGSFAAFDWMMSTEPDWQSNIYGLYVLAGGFVACVALVAIIMRAWRSTGLLPPDVSEAHFSAVGRVLTAAVMVWAYIAFSQFMLLWIANIPAEVAFYRIRVQNGWWAIAVLLVAGNFAVPFLALLSRDVKRDPRALSWIAAWLLVFHYIDMYWLIMPALFPMGPEPSWMDLGALLLVTGACLTLGAWRAQRVGRVVQNDPQLIESLTYTSR